MSVPLLLFATFCVISGASASHAAAPPMDLKPVVVSRQVGPGESFITAIDVKPGQRVVFSGLQSTATIKAVTLRSPDGLVTWNKSPNELGFIPRNLVAHHPDRGDVISLPAIERPQPGRWTLTIATATTSVQGTAIFAYHVLHARELYVVPSLYVAPAGKPLLVLVYALDDGLPLDGLLAVEVAARCDDGTYREKAIQGRRTATGILISSIPGSYTAMLTIDRPGSCSLVAVHDDTPVGPPTFIRVTPP